ncbi:MAG TPA: peptide chain release factor-like protein [Phycisphaerales bacterium]|nr:peptide chain release factor-like protein [Phycisphaerales bacterium]
MSPWPHPACLPDDRLLAQCTVGTGRTGGPGGQNRNKVETLIKLRHTATGVESHAGERRSQMENKRVALRRLRLSLAVAARTRVPEGPVGSELWRSRRREPPKHATAGSPPKSAWDSGGEGTLEINPDHHDYPAMLAEALDVLAASGWDPKPASLRLNCSASQLVKLIKEHPPAFLMVNQQRVAFNLLPLK